MDRIQIHESYFERVLGLEYFDGPMTGVAIQADGKAYYFTIVGWDEEHHERVFAVAEIQTKVAERVWRAFEAVEVPRLPMWYPQSDGTGDTRAEVDAAIAALRIEWEDRGFRRIIQSRDLTGRVIDTELNDADFHTIQEMVSVGKVLEVKSASVLDEFIRMLHT